MGTCLLDFSVNGRVKQVTCLLSEVYFARLIIRCMTYTYYITYNGLSFVISLFIEVDHILCLLFLLCLWIFKLGSAVAYICNNTSFVNSLGLSSDSNLTDYCHRSYHYIDMFVVWKQVAFQLYFWAWYSYPRGFIVVLYII